MNITRYRRWYYLLSAVVILPGLIAMILSLISFRSPVRLSIEFTGGVLWEVRFNKPVLPGEVVRLFQDNGFPDTNVNTIGDEQTLEIRTDVMTPDQKQRLVEAMTAAFGETPEEVQYALVGPVVGAEVTRTAIIAVFFASLAILGFIIWAFRNVSHPFRFGMCAIIAMLHDVLVTVGFVSIMGWVAGWQADALTLTALLTVIGFSVQDTIVVFDRIRENMVLLRREAMTIEKVVNLSINQTLSRTILTSGTTLIVVVILFLFGGEVIRGFSFCMLAGIIVGTYSSIFIAAPLVVEWYHRHQTAKIKMKPVGVR